MKTQLSLIAVVVVALFSISASAPSELKAVSKSTTEIKAKVNAGFKFFRTHRQGRGVTSTWGMESESGVANFTLMRTYEDPGDPYAYWEEVCSMPCNSSRSYKWTDENVSPGYISYCVVANMNGGGTITTWINTIRIVSH